MKITILPPSGTETTEAPIWEIRPSPCDLLWFTPRHHPVLFRDDGPGEPHSLSPRDRALLRATLTVALQILDETERST